MKHLIFAKRSDRRSSVNVVFSCEPLESRVLRSGDVVRPIVTLSREGQQFRAVQGEWIVSLTDGFDAYSSLLLSGTVGNTPTKKLANLIKPISSDVRFEKYLGDTQTFKINAGTLDYDTILKHFEKVGSVLSLEPNLIGTLAATAPSEIDGINDVQARPYWYDKLALIDAGDPSKPGKGGWDYSKGSSSLVVALLDSGVKYTHPDLSRNVFRTSSGAIGGYDFKDSDNAPLDEQRHGTEVAGVLSAEANGGGAAVGVNWNGKYMPLRISSYGSDPQETDPMIELSNAIEAVQYICDQNDLGVNVRVVNASFGYEKWPQANLVGTNESVPSLLLKLQKA